MRGEHRNYNSVGESDGGWVMRGEWWGVSDEGWVMSYEGWIMRLEWCEMKAYGCALCMHGVNWKIIQSFRSIHSAKRPFSIHPFLQIIKIWGAARNWIISVPPQHQRPLPALLYKSFFYAPKSTWREESSVENCMKSAAAANNQKLS